MLEDACRANPDAQGILITRPNYYGIAKNLDEIVEIANKFKMPLLVDEAHGAHSFSMRPFQVHVWVQV